MIDVDAIARAAGLPSDVPISIAAFRDGGEIAQFVSGVWPDGRRVAPDDIFYAGSLTKQLTGAAIALLARDGRIDVDKPLRHFLADLPAWAERVTVRDLLHHASGLPPAGVMESGLGSRHWTNNYVMTALKAPDLSLAAAGENFSYSNAGYFCLARVVEHVSGMSFADFVVAKLVAPLAIEGMHVLLDGEMPAYPQVGLMGPALPLSTGDGGLWTTASAFATWLDRQNHDVLKIAQLVEQPGKLADGTAIAYGWGVGIRTFEGQAMFIHGGGWQGAFAKAVRSPALGLSVAGFAAHSSPDRIVAVTDAVFERLAAVAPDGTAP